MHLLRVHHPLERKLQSSDEGVMALLKQELRLIDLHIFTTICLPLHFVPIDVLLVLY